MKVIAGREYIYHPNLLDLVDGRTALESGDVVRVVNLPGCPKANTMGHAHVEKDGHFAGLVHTNSLHTRAEYADYLRKCIATMESDGTSGQDRKSYSDTQDRKNYHVE